MPALYRERLTHANVVAVLAILWAMAITWGLPGKSFAAFPGANGPIVYTAETGLWMIDPDGSDKQQLVRNRRGYLSAWPAVSPDGQTVAFALSRTRGPDGLGLIGIDGTNRRQVTDGADSDPSFSPDGRSIVYAHYRPHGYSDIHLVAADGSGDRKLIHLPGNDLDPTFSPDGSKIAWSHLGAAAHGGSSLYVMSSDGSDAHPITDGTRYDVFGSPDFLPDGSGIIFDGTGCVCSMRPDGSHIRKLVTAGFPNQPTVSPDGTRMAYLDDVFSTLVVSDIDGRHRVSLRNAESGYQPAWAVAAP